MNPPGLSHEVAYLRSIVQKNHKNTFNLFQNFHDRQAKYDSGRGRTTSIFYVICYVLPYDNPFRIETIRRKLKKIWCYSALHIVLVSASAGVYIHILKKLIYSEIYTKPKYIVWPERRVVEF